MLNLFDTRLAENMMAAADSFFEAKSNQQLMQFVKSDIPIRLAGKYLLK
jgi:hypothetical protein